MAAASTRRLVQVLPEAPPSSTLYQPGFGFGFMCLNMLLLIVISVAVL